MPPMPGNILNHSKQKLGNSSDSQNCRRAERMHCRQRIFGQCTYSGHVAMNCICLFAAAMTLCSLLLCLGLRRHGLLTLGKIINGSRLAKEACNGGLTAVEATKGRA